MPKDSNAENDLVERLDVTARHEGCPEETVDSSLIRREVVTESEKSDSHHKSATGSESQPPPLVPPGLTLIPTKVLQELTSLIRPAAKQAGAYVAAVIAATARGRPTKPFAYRHYGSLATIGRKAAVAEFGRVRCKGALAWWLWGAVHILFLIGGRNRAAVILGWLWDYFTLRRGTRLIVGSEPERTAQ